MVITTMIKYHIHHHFKPSIIFVRTETRINTIIIGRCITMIAALTIHVGQIVFQHGGKPKGSNPQLVEIV